MSAEEPSISELMAKEEVGRAPGPDEVKLWEFLREDISETLRFLRWDNEGITGKVKALVLPSIWAVVFYRISSWAFHRSRLLWPVAMFFFWLNIVLFSCEIAPGARIGPGMMIAHTVGVGIGHGVEIGKRFRIMKGATIGSAGRFLNRDPGVPTLGDDVWLMFMGAIGGKVTIGNRVMIAAGAGVVTDIPHHSFVLGNMTTREFLDLDLVIPEWQQPVQGPDGEWSSPNCRTIFGPPVPGFEPPPPEGS